MEEFSVEDRRHRMGGVLMYGGLAASALAVLGVVPFAPFWGMGFFAVSLVLCGSGVYLKKRYCPRCRADGCDLT